MIKRNLIKQSKFKRLILKLFNIHAIEKETFNLLNPYTLNQGKNFFRFNKQSFILSNGYLNFSRKIESLDIFYRFSPDVPLWNSSGTWKRIIQNIDKKILIKTSLLSLKKSILFFLEKNKLNINLNLIHDQSNEKFNDEIKSLLENDGFNINFFKNKINGNRGSFLECCDQCENSKDLIYFIEDDYIFKKESIDEILFSYSRISTLINNDVFLCPTDHPFYYDSNYQTSIFIGKNYRWRIVQDTLLTFLFSKKLFNKFKSEIRLVGEQKNDPFEKPLHEIFQKVPCLAPIFSTSYHFSRTVPGVEDHWIKLWKNLHKEIIGGP